MWGRRLIVMLIAYTQWLMAPASPRWPLIPRPLMAAVITSDGL